MSKDSPNDLKVRTLSAIVMIAVAGSALWAGGWVFTAFVALVAVGLLWEWWGLISKFNQRWWSRALWMLGGVVYIGGASFFLGAIDIRTYSGASVALLPIVTVVIIDVFAYLAGRFIGGAKLFPSISPNKTWSGFFGGIIGAILVYFALIAWGQGMVRSDRMPIDQMAVQLLLGTIGFSCVSIVAQAGDFFQSWLKRSAAVKDSGGLIPGHGGLFDRLDGLIAVCFLGFLVFAVFVLRFEVITTLGYPSPGFE